jgi:hypothetical protein
MLCYTQDDASAGEGMYFFVVSLNYTILLNYLLYIFLILDEVRDYFFF